MGKKKILVVDDDQNIVKLVKFNLDRAGYQTFAAFNGREALIQIPRIWPDMLVLDFVMPQMNGLETLKHLRASAKTRNLPVIMLTAQTSDKDLFKGYSFGADLYLTKPVNPALLLSYVKQLFSHIEQEEKNDDVYDL